MPARKGSRLPSSFAETYYLVSRDKLRELGDSLAQEAGPPTSVAVDPATEADRVKAWTTPHPRATPQAMAQLAQQKYAEHRGAGMDDEMARLATAEDVTHFMYPGRQPLYMQGTVSWTEQVREAARLAKAAERRTAEASTTADGGDLGLGPLPMGPVGGATAGAPVTPSSGPPPSAVVPPAGVMPTGGPNDGY